jgi:MSHA biogenesis protein MshI
MALEVQRSLDYYESHFAQPPINKLLLAPAEESVAEFVPYLDKQLAQQVELLDLNTLLISDAPLEPALQGPCFTAIGLALREESAEAA